MNRRLSIFACGCLVLAGLVVFSSQARSSSPARATTWEYAALIRSKVWDAELGTRPSWSPWHTVLNDVEQPNAPLAEHLNRLGSQGWELVSVAPMGGENDRSLYYLFKRPRP